MGTNIRKPTVEYSEDEYQLVMSTNLEATYKLSQVPPLCQLVGKTKFAHHCMAIQVTFNPLWLVSMVHIVSAKCTCLSTNCALLMPTEGVSSAERSRFSSNGAHLVCGWWPNSHEEWHTVCNDQRQAYCCLRLVLQHDLGGHVCKQTLHISTNQKV